MKIFLDTADIGEIREGVAMGLVDGVTTNPTLVAKTGRPFRKVIAEICEVVSGPVSAEVIGLAVDEMMREATELASIAPNVAVKLPMTVDGLKAVKACAEKKIKTNVTLVFQPLQGLFAARAGATFVSPFVGRLDDLSQDGMSLISDLMQMFDNYGLDTEVIVASIRHPMHVVQTALIGAHIATIPFKVLTGLTKHPLTDRGIESFLEDYKRIPKS